MMWWYGPGVGGWGVALMTVTMILFWVLAVVGVVALIRHLARGDGAGVRRADEPRADKPRAEDLLAERFARGELDEREYRERLDVIREARISRT